MRKLPEDTGPAGPTRADFVIHTLEPDKPGLLPDVDLEHSELIAQILGDNDSHAPA